ncbi:MAG TPA: tetratricopeptide repeat protein [Candidatus Acidoferrales bacterium]|nr:tetratricopeptide repeat protein [Candidatus Acidoferrales bacterium]
MKFSVPRFAWIALAIFATAAPAMARASAAGGATVLALLREESIPGADLPSPGASPSPAASPAAEASPAPDANSNPAAWVKVPASPPTPAAHTAPAPASSSNPAAMSPAAAPTSDESGGAANPAAAAAAPTDVPPAFDIGAVPLTQQVSDTSLDPLIKTAPTPARAASLRVTERQRVELEKGHTNDAVRELAHAVSIDPSNSYAYFYLGRAYAVRGDYAQAITFFKRAEIGLASDSAWLGETYAYEGVSLEQTGKSAEAAAAYQKALAASPGNLTARVGYTRLGAFAPVSATSVGGPPAPDAVQPPPAEPEIPGPPNEPPVPGAPHSSPVPEAPDSD